MMLGLGGAMPGLGGARTEHVLARGTHAITPVSTVPMMIASLIEATTAGSHN